jgi:hypothetical protein
VNERGLKVDQVKKEKWMEEVTPASEIHKVTRKIVTLPTYGWKLPIRALGPFDFAKFGEIPLKKDALEAQAILDQVPDVVMEKIKGKGGEEGESVEEEEEFDVLSMIPDDVKRGNIRKNLDWSEDCVVAAVIPTPQLMLVKTGEPCPPNGIWASEVKKDWQFLVDEVLALSDLGTENESPFRKEAEPDDSGSDGKEVQPSAP